MVGEEDEWLGAGPLRELMWIPHIRDSATLFFTTRAKLLIRLIQGCFNPRLFILLQLSACTREFFASRLKGDVYSLRRIAEDPPLPSISATFSSPHP